MKTDKTEKPQTNESDVGRTVKGTVKEIGVKTKLGFTVFKE